MYSFKLCVNNIKAVFCHPFHVPVFIQCVQMNFCFVLYMYIVAYQTDGGQEGDSHKGQQLKAVVTYSTKGIGFRVLLPMNGACRNAQSPMTWTKQYMCVYDVL